MSVCIERRAARAGGRAGSWMMSPGGKWRTAPGTNNCLATSSLPPSRTSVTNRRAATLLVSTDMRQASYYGMHALLSTALGVGAIAFGIPAVVTPVWFARLFGIGSAEDPTVATAIRSVGIRDVVIGLGL